MTRRCPGVSILLPDLRGGGAERVNINLANEFVARGVPVDMLLMDPSGQLMPLLDSRVRVIDLRAARIRGVVLPLFCYLRKTRPSSLLACMWPLTILAVLARIAARVRTRVVVAEHTTWSAAERSGDAFHRLCLLATTRMAFPQADGVVAVSKGAAKDLASIVMLPISRISAIYNPIVGGVKSAAVESLPAPDEWRVGSHYKILAVGTLKAIKDYDTLLRAFAILRGKVDAKLLILGEGEERVALEKLIATLSIGTSVFLPGFSTAPETYFKVADLHVLSSTGEGFGNVIVEALEAGTPVVSTDCPSGPREILDHGRYGALVPVADPKALALAMHDALGREHDKAALKARAADFSVSKAADAYLDLLLPDWRHSPLLAEANG